jgi:ferrous iron transport protein A
VITTLAQLRPGQRARITGYAPGGAVRRRCLEMGLVRGETITAERVAPLGDPRWYLVKGCRLALRREEAALIQVEGIGA